jgi:hypothetical protein
MPTEGPPGLSVVGRILFVPVIAIGLLFVVLFVAVLWPFLLQGWFARRRHLRRLVEQRPGEDIGTFARAFDRHIEPFDPWVVRATWDALVPCVRHGDWHVPLRPTDRLAEDLGIDLDEFRLELLEEVAVRSRHTLDNPENNPVPWEIETVGDLVRFVTLQPRVAESSR